MGVKRRSLIKIAAGIPIGVAHRRVPESTEARLESRVGPIGYGGISPRDARSAPPPTAVAGSTESATDDGAAGSDGRTGGATGYGAPAYGTPQE